MPNVYRQFVGRILARVDVAPSERWNAEIGVGVLGALVVTEVLILIGTAPGNGFFSAPTLLVASEAGVAVGGLAAIYWTGRWRGPVLAVIGGTTLYLMILQVVLGIDEPGVAPAITLLLATITFLVGHTWAWLAYMLIVFTYAGMVLPIGPGATLDIAEVTKAIGLAGTQAAGMLIFGVVERARARAVNDAILKGKAEEQAAAAQLLAASKGAFLATMSHEIRTPMNAVLNMQRMLADTTLSEEQTKLLQTAQASSEALLGVLNDILDFSRIDAGQLVLEQHSFDVQALAEEVVQLFGPSARKKGIGIGLEVSSAFHACVVGDSARVRQILNNLVSNAVKFTLTGSVVLRLRRPSEQVLVIEVEDSGIGIPPEQLDRLFLAFTQADSSTTRRFGGTGLGLAISKKLCEAMGGTITATSKAHVGSTFRVQLPLAKAPCEEPAADSVLAGVDTPHRFVLIAEDNPVNQLVLCRILDKLGATYDCVADGQQAVEFASNKRYDIVLMDIHMPVLSGLDATRRIRQLPKPACDVPIFAVSASVLASERMACFDAGMDGHIAKPLRIEELSEVLSQPRASLRNTS